MSSVVTREIAKPGKRFSMQDRVELQVMVEELSGLYITSDHFIEMPRISLRFIKDSFTLRTRDLYLIKMRFF